MAGSQKEVAMTAQCRKRRRISQSQARQTRLTKPSPTQSEEGNKLVLRAAASLMEPELSDGVGAEKIRIMTRTDSDSRISTPEDLPHVTPKSSEYII
ncbi:hypothetical protein NDU88_005474 [Pleurodeles waltl]|uniref:Uncharacterized protein n=1 Tax=Pleurodeles waltl TaxID=8319 RepID=A0AAV7RIL9_PLEWA|nr:hypothetical protein NDU88_005474 [Pleurodeles waltl]